LTSDRFPPIFPEKFPRLLVLCCLPLCQSLALDGFVRGKETEKRIVTSGVSAAVLGSRQKRSPVFLELGNLASCEEQTKIRRPVARRGI
jgi:hypothetical protein